MPLPCRLDSCVPDHVPTLKITDATVKGEAESANASLMNG
jgi:hypothetical protein